MSSFCYEKKNKHVQRWKTSAAKFRKMVRSVALDLDASQMATLSGLNRHAINRDLQGIRRIAPVCEYQSP